MSNFFSPVNLNGNRRTFLDDSFILLNSKNQKNYNDGNSSNVNSSASAYISNDDAPGHLHTTGINHNNNNNNNSSSSSNIGASHDGYFSTGNSNAVSLGPKATLASIWSKNGSGTNNDNSALNKYDLFSGKSSAFGGNNNLSSTSNFYPTDNIMPAASSTASNTPSATNSTSASLMSNPLSFTNFNNNGSAAPSAVSNTNFQGSDSFTAPSNDIDNSISGASGGRTINSTLNFNSGFNDQLFDFGGSTNTGNTGTTGNTSSAFGNSKTSGTSTPRFPAFDTTCSNSNNTISSYLDINTSTYQNNRAAVQLNTNKHNGFNKTNNGSRFMDAPFSNPINHNNAKNANNTTTSNTETPLTTPVLSSNLYSRFFPSPTSERVRYNYNTTNNTPSASTNNYNNNDHITHLNLASSLNTPTDSYKNLTGDNLFLDTSFNSVGRVPNGSTHNDMNYNMNHNANNILDTLKNKSLDSFDLAFEKNTEDMIPNFIHDESQTTDNDIFLRNSNSNTEESYNGNNAQNLFLNSLDATQSYSNPSNTVSSSVPSVSNLSLNGANSNDGQYNTGYFSNSDPYTQRRNSNFLHLLNSQGNNNNNIINNKDKDRINSSLTTQNSKQLSSPAQKVNNALQINLDEKDENQCAVNSLSLKHKKLVAHSNDLENQINSMNTQFSEALKKNGDDEDDILVSLEGFNLGGSLPPKQLPPKEEIHELNGNNISVNGNDESTDEEELHPKISLDSIVNYDASYPEGFSSTFYKRADNNFMFVREIQAKSTIIKFKSSSIIEFRLSLPSIPLFTTENNKETTKSEKPEGLGKKKKYKSYAVQINLNELEGKIGGLRVSKQQALQQQLQHQQLQKHDSHSSSSKKYSGSHYRKSGGLKHKSSNAYYYKKGYINSISSKAK